MLGIIIGVASVIVLVSLVDGMKKSIVDQFEAMGTNLITVSIPGRGGNRTVTPIDIMDFADKNKDTIGYVTPTVMVGTTTVKYQTESIDTNCIGTNEFYPDVKNVKVVNGRYLEYVDIDRRQKNCVVGSYVANKLFNSQQVAGKELKIKGDTYTIVGVLEAKQSSVEGSEDDRVYIPYSLAMLISRNRMVSSYSFSAATKETVSTAMDKINAFLFQIFSSEDAYRTYNQADSLEKVNEMTGKMTLLLVGIAAISLLVGGIGIMNIMLVSVTERTREIGIRKALGATPWDIMSQFVVEAATTSSFGGFLGIGLGIGASYLLGKALKLSAEPSLVAIAIAFSVSVAIGMTFGYFPAKKASKLNPIDALRYD
jgi:putative ABC transport system permease protein